MKNFGHIIKSENDDEYLKGAFGGYQAIMFKNNVYIGASESRKDGYAAGY